MKKLVVMLLALSFICLTFVGCDMLPDEVKDILGIVVEIPEPDENGNQNNVGGIHIHKYEEIKTEPTCYEQGFTTYYCECGKIPNLHRKRLE